MKDGVILCPVDFSEASRHATRYALALADATGATIVGLHVHQPALAGIPAGIGRDDPVVEPSVGSPEIRDRIAAQFGRLPADDARLVSELAIGTPADAIAERALTSRADLIVIGTRGAGGLQHLLLGSVTEDVMRKAPVPVLAVPPRADAAPTLPFSQVLFATDFSAASLAAMDAGLRLVGENTRATVLHVIDDSAEDDLFVARPYDVHRHAEMLERHVSESLLALARDRFDGACAPAARLAHGRAADQILAVAGEIGADLLIMGVHGRNALDLAIFGSTTNEVVRRAACPVLSARR
jgi:nucleotide-binding universal stress UspA family protein